MARTARLEVEVNGRGAKVGADTAAQSLRGLRREAGAADRELKNLSGDADRSGNAMGNLGRRSNAADKEMRQASASADRLGNSLRRVGTEGERAGRGARSAAGGINGMAGSMMALRSAAVVVIALGIGKVFLDAADKTKLMESQLKLATREWGNFGTAMQDVRRIAQETRGGLEATSELYTKFALVSKEMGKSQADAARATETFSKALKVGGSDAASAAAVTRQFGQALQSGSLRGDEFNSMMENSPRVAKLLADSLGKPVASLREMAREGLLTSDILYKALTDPDFTGKIDEEFRQIPVTFKEAMVQLTDAATVTFAAFDRGGQFSQALTNFMLGGVEDLDTLERRAEDWGVSFRATMAGLSNVWEPIRDGFATFFNWLDERMGGDGIGGKLLDYVGRKYEESFKSNPNSTLAQGVNLFRSGRDASLRTGQADIDTLRLERSPLTNSQAFSRFTMDPQNYDIFGKYVGKPMPRATAGGDDDKKTEKARSRPQVLNDFISELSKRGVGTVDNPIRTARRQNELYKQGLTPLDGINRFSRHQNAQAVDFNRATFDEGKVRQAAAAAGIKGLKIVTESGGRKHAEWTGAGKQGDLGDQLAEQEREMERLEKERIKNAERQLKLAEERQQKQDDFWQSLENEVQLARMLPQEAEQFNAELELTKALNHGIEGEQKKITDLQKIQIGLQIRLRDEAALEGKMRAGAREAQFEQTRLLEEQATLSASNVANEEMNLALNERMWPLKLEALQAGIPLQDLMTSSAYLELEAREKTNLEIARKNQLIRQGNATVDRLNDEADPRRAAGRRYQAAAIEIMNSTRPQQEKDRAIEQLTKQFEGEMGEISRAWRDTMIGHVNQIGDALGGKVGKAVGALGNIAIFMAETARAGYKNGEMGASSNNRTSGVLNGLKGVTDKLTETLGGTGRTGSFLKGLSSKLGKASDGAAAGDMMADLVKAVGFKKFSRTGAQVGGAIGSFLPIPGGQFIGAAVGGTIGSFFKKSPYSTAVLSGGGDFDTVGRGKGKDNATGLGGAVQGGLKNIADQLGATVGAFKVSIGEYNKEIRVSTTGFSGKLNKKGSSGVGLKGFGQDAEAAIRFAIQDAIKDGALVGLSATANRLIQQAGDDLDRAIADVLKLQSVKDELRSIEDPMNFALEQLNKAFEDIAGILRKGSATAEEFADAERLYQLKRTEIIENGNNNAIKAMRDYVFQLTGGTGSALSPELRYNTAKAELDALDAKRASGGKVDFDQYRGVSDAFLAASRDAKGSTTGFFADLNRVTSSVNTWIEEQKTGVNTPTVDFTPVVTSIDSQTGVIGGLLQQLINQGAGVGGGVASEPTSHVQISAPRYQDSRMVAH